MKRRRQTPELLTVPDIEALLDDLGLDPDLRHSLEKLLAVTQAAEAKRRQEAREQAHTDSCEPDKREARLPYVD